MADVDSRVTIHMAASLDGFVARKDGRVDWLETADEFEGGETMTPAFVEAFLKTIDCYVMGSRTYETARRFEAQGLGWSYGDKPTFVLTSRDLPRTRESVEFHSGDLATFVNEQLRPRFRAIWFVGGSVVSAECLRLGLADEVRYSILPIVIGDGIPFFDKLDKDVALHLAEVKAYKSGMVALRYEVPGPRGAFIPAGGATPVDDRFGLSRFVHAQADDFEQALSEIKNGSKQSHWMWYIFPQYDGLGSSAKAKQYAIRSVAEAEAYLRHPVLGPRLLQCAEAVIAVEGRSAAEIFGFPDDLKLRSCATLFACVSPPGSVFERLIDKYFRGERDGQTVRLLSA